jgi:hypothetical protein
MFLPRPQENLERASFFFVLLVVLLVNKENKENYKEKETKRK